MRPVAPGTLSSKRSLRPLASYDYLGQKAPSIAPGKIEQLKSVSVVVSDPIRDASIAFTLTAGAEFTLFEFLPALCSNEDLGFLNTSCVPDDTNSTFLAAGLDSTRIRLGFDFSPGSLRCYKRRNKK